MSDETSVSESYIFMIYINDVALLSEHSANLLNLKLVYITSYNEILPYPTLSA